MFPQTTTICALVLMKPVIRVLLYAGVPAVAVSFAILYIRKRRRKAAYEAKRIRELNFAKLELLSQVDHDLHAPLTMISAPLDRLRNDPRGIPVQKELDEIRLGARILQDQIDQILEIKSLDRRGSVYHPSYGDLAKFVEETTGLYAVITPSVASGLTFDSDGPAMTDFDPDKMRRIGFNLLGNAFANCQENPEVHVSVRRNGDNIDITVSDNGKTLPEKTQAKLKESFSLPITKNESFGLNLAGDYVHMHGGFLSYQPGKPFGNFFTVSIPVKNTMMKTPDATDCKKTEFVGERKHILNVEDNPDFRAFITGHLSDKYCVSEAGNGKEAAKIIENTAIDLVLSDVRMPEMDGRELCRWIRSDIRYSHIPVILLTAVHGKESELENLKAGADDSIEKPFDIETLLVRIERILKRKLEDRSAAIPERRISRVDRELLDRVDAEIEENLQNSEYTIESLCSALSVSRSGLYKKLMALTGKSPLEYIRIKRLLKGRQMLESGETSVSQIAWSVGFSPKQFSRYFKDEYGCLPSEYIHHLSD